MSIIKTIRAGDRVEYQIVRREGNPPMYGVLYRNPDIELLKCGTWWQRLRYRWRGGWSMMMTSGLYYNTPLSFSSCHDAEAAIDGDVRERIGMAEGWIPVTCAEEGSRNH